MGFETTVRLADLIAAMIRRWKGIGVSLLVSALLLGGWQGYRQYGLANDPENAPEKIEERYEAALEDYEAKKEGLQEKLEAREESLAAKEEYQEKSLLMQIDPYDKYVANVVFAFSDIDESAQLFRYPNTAADYLPKKIRSQYMELWKSMDVPRDIGLAKYADVEGKYLSEVVSVASLEGELVSIRACGAAASDAEELADAVYRYFDAHRDVIAAGSAQHGFALMNRTVKNVIDEDLKTKQEDLEKEIEDLKAAIEDSKQAIEDLEEPVREEGYSAAAIAKAVAKYAAIGAAVGVCLACAAVCCWWIFADKAAGPSQLERMVEAPFLGSLSIPRTPAERLAVKVAGERSWRDREQAASYIVQQAKARFPKDGTVLLLSTLPQEKVGAEMDGLVEVLSKGGCRAAAVLDAVHDPRAVEALQGCAAVAVVERTGASRVAAVRDIAAQAELAGKPVLGVVTI
ncbi:hypothetical protein [uncultured Oscillibacter sp.]|uniref:hypothetical protein n=1 Tax=uncultured Oscillibacter sp. TaxID=876091 RepID=UPI0025DFC474|nr:hypothetical protein [uncultured Oscillibacter sp.]